MKINEVRDNIEKRENENKSNESIAFQNHIEFIEKQDDALTEFLTNLESLKIKIKNDNSFSVVAALLYDSIKKSRICRDLALKGHYDESMLLLRKIFDNTTQIIYLSQNPNKWQDWVNYCNWRQNQYEGKNPPRLKNNDFTLQTPDFLKLIKMENYYKLYKYLSSHIHASSEVLRTNFEPLDGRLLFHPSPRYRKDKLEFCLNLIYGFINDSIWKGIKDVVDFGEVPEYMDGYHKTQASASKCFDKFYI